ncbi:tRNA (guanine-N(7)-)-methyltransferase, putative [Entamoeba dispar SAW760]|uniref:tRNA (guanine-N(7)-)-methyltransferase n=1 Tax=Entamoeba dispar (strain ATCC PRA-260 / SAW760) TaxID=370354 RepID=B0EEF6_ENTDS|nr:tRNA (guanine-N(7)-)-methyltransferase, putative [Entamoeba dispar SAW760]EDR27070.1 tRNA (guanine-N(7)-)-methyltransferase, putative [Entamoeba dispar SAW760]|eukprot:EDR27070.1 tRNA (guanine-N(7)-)-methyltransferase, putative [Entamoeba dispar SAW760]
MSSEHQITEHSHDSIIKKKKSIKPFHRVHAHRNPLADSPSTNPITPQSLDWKLYFPNGKPAEMLDIGCGWGGLVREVGIIQEKNVLGMEIRDPAVQYGLEKIQTAREKNELMNVWIIQCNCMKYVDNYFVKGQLLKIFITFPDPHFKNSVKRRRIINPHFAAMYVYLLKPGEGMLYTASDVKELFDWNTQSLDQQPLLERMPDNYTDDYLNIVMFKTEEAKKVDREQRQKWGACYRRRIEEPF